MILIQSYRPKRTTVLRQGVTIGGEKDGSSYFPVSMPILSLEISMRGVRDILLRLVRRHN